MKYIIKTDEFCLVITDDPVGYVYNFEPIDVIDGQILVWDEQANLYHFGPKKELKNKNLIGNISWQEVGEWKEGEPYLIKIKKSDENDLSKLLIQVIKADESNSNKKNPSLKTNFENLSLKELINLVEKVKLS